ncbi:MAG: hypothetical protein WA192_05080 [Candidatus Acidiferrales bacterium]
MRRAMERFLTVNDFSGSPPVPRGNQEFDFDPGSDAGQEFGVEPTEYGVAATEYGVAGAAPSRPGDQGPCLYLGPQGQRCGRRAVANGFCSRHMPAQPSRSGQPGVASRSSRSLPRIVAAGLAILAAIWPVVADLLREIIRWIHAH